MELEPLNEDASKLRKTMVEDQHTDIKDERGQWGNRVEFLLAIIGFSVGMGNIWRFPMLCASNGGGAFLIPFCFFMFICAGPLYYIEVCIGQFSGQSAGSAFEFCPLFKGMCKLYFCLLNAYMYSCIFKLTICPYFKSF